MTSPKKYDWSQFTLKIAINTAPARLYKAWTDEKEIVKWFTVKAEIEPKKNGRLYFEWLAGDKLTAKVKEVRKNQKFVFPFGSYGEEVEISIKKMGKGSVCILRQYNMKTSPKQRWVMHRGCLEGWTFFLTNLKVWLEHGIDLRSQDPKVSYAQGFINS